MAPPRESTIRTRLSLMSTSPSSPARQRRQPSAGHAPRLRVPDEKLPVAVEGVEQLLHILDRVVCVRRDAQVPGARGGDDALAVECLYQGRRIGRGDAQERSPPLRLARGGDAGAE